MKSKTTLQNEFTDLSGNQAAANAARGLTLINDSCRYLSTKFYFNEVLQDIPGGTIAGVKSYPLPYNIKELVDFYIVVGSLRYTPTEIPTATFYDQLQFAQYSSDIPQYYWIFSNQIHIFPTPSSSGNQMSMRYKRRLRDLSQADYTTGTVSVTQFKIGSASNIANNATFTGAVSNSTPILANNDVVQLFGTTLPTGFTAGTNYYVINETGTNASSYTFQLSATLAGAAIVPTTAGSSNMTYNVISNVITGSATSWTEDMGGRWIQITANSTSNTTSGDQNWYQIYNVASSTSLTLVNNYQGNTVVGGSYTIGEMPILPEDYQDLPLYRALEIYYTSITPSPTQAELYKGLYDSGYVRLSEEYGNKSTDPSIYSTDVDLQNPNLFLRNIG